MAGWDIWEQIAIYHKKFAGILFPCYFYVRFLNPNFVEATMEKRIEQLLKTNPRFKKLHLDHQKCEKKLKAMKAILHFTEKDEVEWKKIHKVKLLKKDAMEKMLASVEFKGK
jgi:tRNA isopentenyl-2-thiomethyl-A-37 hydroxylase MiaE